MESFKSLEQIVEQIAVYVNQLNSGKLSPTDIDLVLSEVGQLQERLIILRYKAFEQQVKENDEAEEVSFEKPVSFSASIATAPAYEETAPQQTSLIDAIEAVENDVIDPSSHVPPEEVVPTDLPVMAIPSPPIKESHDELTLAEKLQKTAVGDLKKAISLNQKFVFINELFRQNADDYHSSIDQLNNFDELEEAMSFVKTQLMPLYNWNIEDKTTEHFLDLIERRYL